MWIEFVYASSLILLLVLAYGFSRVFRRLGIPAFIGEITAGALWAGLQIQGSVPREANLILESPSLPLLSQAGILCLMFLSGTESQFQSFGAGPYSTRLSEVRLVALLSFLGCCIPAVGGAILLLSPLPPFANHWRETLLLEWTAPAGRVSEVIWVCLCALAITSVPVISRIFSDLGLLGTRLSRVVLGTAVLEDAVLFSVMGLALPSLSQGFTPRPELALMEFSQFAAGHLLSVLSILVLGALWKRTREPQLRSQFPHLRDFLFSALLAILALLLELPGFLVAFTAGLTLSASSLQRSQKWKTLQSSIRSSLIPLAFAWIGAKLVINSGSVPQHPFAWLTLSLTLLLLIGSTLKILSIFFTARSLGESKDTALDLAFALNARGGPAIVLAELSEQAGIISARFHFELVVFAILTSWAAALWLRQRTVIRLLKTDTGIEPIPQLRSDVILR